MSRPSVPATSSHNNSDDACVSEQPTYVCTDVNERKQNGPCIIEGVPFPNTDEEWISYIQKSSHVDARSPSVVSIFRVPGTLIEVSKDRGVYVPKRVSLGPYHHGTSAGLAAISGHHKPRALCRMMERFNANQAGPINMDFSVRARKAIVEVQEVIKNNYDGNADCEGENLATMLTLDGCFILEIMRLLVTEMPPNGCYDPLFENSRLLHVECDLLADILKLENQIPLIVLRKLLELELNMGDVTDVLSQIVLRFLLIFYPFDNGEMEAYVTDGGLLSIFKQRLVQKDQGHHLLDFFRTLVVFAPFGNAGNNSVSVDVGSMGGDDAGSTLLFNKWDDDALDEERERERGYHVVADIPCAGERERESLSCGSKVEYHVVRDIPDIPCAVDLANAGIRFKQCRGGIKNICFEPRSATIYLPLIIVNDSTDIAFFNLMAFEMQKQFKTNYVLNYMYLMKKLIVSKEDVLLLKREGVLCSFSRSNKEVAELFRNICNGISINSEYLMGGLATQVMVHCKTQIKWYGFTLWNDYFSTPWKTLGVVVATLLVALTIVQTIFIILALFK